MAEIDVLKAQIVRDSPSVPWGFRLQGGADFGQPLTILRITPGSPAARIGLKSGDEVTEIGDVVTTHLSHDQASAVIAQYGQSLILTVERRARGSIPTQPIMNPAPAPGQQHRGYDMYDLTGNPNQAPHHTQHHTPSYQQQQEYQQASARPFEPPKLPRPGPPVQPEQEAPVYRPQPQPGPPPQQQQQQYSTYTDDMPENDNVLQSRTFKILQNLMENDGEPPPPVMFARKTPGAPSVTIPGTGNQPKVIANRQFNTPIGLYDHNVAMDTMGQKMEGVSMADVKHERTSSDPTAPKPYIASETMRLVKQLDEEEKLYGRPNFPPPKPSKAPIGRVLDDPILSKPSPGGAYVPSYQMSKSLAHVMRESPSEQVRRFSTGTRPPPEPPEEKERRLSGGNPPGYRKVEPPEPSPLSRPVKAESPGLVATSSTHLSKVDSHGPKPYIPPVRAESPTTSLLTRPMKVEGSAPVPFTRPLKSASPTPYSRPLKAESPTPTPFTRPVKAESPTPAPFTRPVKAESPTPAPFTRPVKAESPTHAPFTLSGRSESPTSALFSSQTTAESPTLSAVVCPVQTESPIASSQSHQGKIGSLTPMATPTPYLHPSNSSLDSGYQAQPSSFKSPLNIDTTSSASSEASSETSSSYPYQPKASPRTPEVQTHTFTSSMVVNTSRAQIKLPGPKMSSPSPPQLSSSVSEVKSSSTEPPSSTPPSTVSHSASSSASSSSAASGTYFIPATGSENGAPVNIATAAATTSIIEAALKPKIRPYKRPEYNDAPVEAPLQTMVTVSPRYQGDENAASSQKQSKQQIVVDEPGFPMATITVLMPEAEAEAPIAETGGSRPTPWYQPSHSPSSSSSSVWSDTHTETQPGGATMVAQPRATIKLPSRRPTSDSSLPESNTTQHEVILNEAPRPTIRVPSTFQSSPDNRHEPSIPTGVVTLNKAPRATVNIPSSFQSSSSPTLETIKQQPRHSLVMSMTSSTKKADLDTSDNSNLNKSETSAGTVSLNEALKKSINILDDFQKEDHQRDIEHADIAASSKGKFQKLTSMFQSKDAESHKPVPAPKRSIKIPSTFTKPEETSHKPTRKEPIKLPTAVHSESSVLGHGIHTSNGSVNSNGTGMRPQPYKPLTNGRSSGFTPYQAQRTEESTMASHTYRSSSNSSIEIPETPTPLDMPPPEFPPPPPPPDTPPPSTLGSDFSSEFPLPPPPPADCPQTPTTPDLPPPPPAIADPSPVAKKEEAKAQQLYQKYADLLKEEDKGPVQSRTFNAITNMMEGEPEPAAGSAGLPPQRSAYRERQRQEAQVARPGGPQGPGAAQQAGSPRVKVFMPQQYNTPLSMYSAQNVVETFQGQAEMQLDQLEQKHPDVISGAQRAVFEADHTRSSSDF